MRDEYVAFRLTKLMVLRSDVGVVAFLFGDLEVLLLEFLYEFESTRTDTTGAAAFLSWLFGMKF